MYRQYCKDLEKSKSKKKRNRLPTYGNKQTSKSKNDQNFKEFSYGKPRKRPQWWERFEDQLKKAVKEREKRLKDKKDKKEKDESPERNDTPPPPPKPEPKPEPPKEELAKVLNVQDIDLHIDKNTVKHRTDRFACTEDREDEKGNKLSAELVVRRGDTIFVTIKFDRPFEKKKHDLEIQFSIGQSHMAMKGTQGVMMLDETGKEACDPDDWGACLKEVSGCDIGVDIHIPANCIVGEWNLAVKSFSTGKNKDGEEETLVFTYNHHDDITILFNPWCKDDAVYMPSTNSLDEYVLNDKGCVFRGNFRCIGAKPWVFGQYEPGILEAALYILFCGFRRKIVAGMSDPVRVARAISKMINSQDDAGVLVGNWSGDYSEGTSPLKWKGSVSILRQFMKTGDSVMFGQCWVFSCLTTTVCRALGIPARTVTNFASAHDTEGSLTIDRYYDKDGKKLPWTSDSVWNFHVWNEVWMERADLDGEDMDGWQVIDATPQEVSGGEYQCGPSPTAAVRKGLCRTNYDSGFVFAEVNADIVNWVQAEDGTYKKESIQKKSVGKCISTKKPDGKPFCEGGAVTAGLCVKKRMDLTNNYKPPEGSEEERQTVMMAYKTAMCPKEGVYDEVDRPVKEIEFKLTHADEVMVGQDLEIQISAKNVGTRTRKIRYVVFEVASVKYTGEEVDMVLMEMVNETEIKPGDEQIHKTLLKADAYLPTISELANYEIRAHALVDAVDDVSAPQQFMRDHVFRFRRPDLDVTGPETCKMGEKAEFKITFKNPLPVALTQCEVSAESSGFDDIEDVKQPDVPPNAEFSCTMKLHARRCKEHEVVFSFECKELKDISGSATIIISK